MRRVVRPLARHGGVVRKDDDEFFREYEDLAQKSRE